MRVVCISDTHGLHDELHAAARIPDGDVLVHAGDFTDTGERDEVLAFNAFLATLPHKHKLVIAGNHESTFDRDFYAHNWHHYGHRQQYDPLEVRALLTNALYLEDQAVLIDGFLFYGSPWQPEFCNWAFNLPRGDKLVAHWRRIPSDVDVLVTHSPPLGRGDQVGHLRVGCGDLLREVQTRIKPTYHVFGHVHEGYGRSSDGVTTFVNASSCTHEYEAVNAPMVIDLTTPRIVHDAAAPDNHKMRYDVMLHEQLRVCSQKPLFVPVAGVDIGVRDKRNHPHGPSHRHHSSNGSMKASLKEFNIDGTTAALLFESTLKLRPVKAEQTRALRYLFHHGFKAGGDEDANTVDVGQSESSGGGDTAATDAENGTTQHSAGSSSEARKRERRRVSLSRRVTMAVLEELPDAKRDAITAPISGDKKTAHSSNGGHASTTALPTARRARRDKTLHRREAVAKLATMVEEPDEKEAAVAPGAATEEAAVEDATHAEGAPAPEAAPAKADCPVPQEALTEEVAAAAAAVAAPPVATQMPAPPPPAPECIMCKYNVLGHVHAGSAIVAASASAAPAKVTPATQPATPAPVAAAAPAASPAAECILCKYKVAGHVHPGAADAVVATDATGGDAAEDEATDAEGGARARPLAPNRQSSWF